MVFRAGLVYIYILSINVLYYILGFFVFSISIKPDRGLTGGAILVLVGLKFNTIILFIIVAGFTFIMQISGKSAIQELVDKLGKDIILTTKEELIPYNN